MQHKPASQTLPVVIIGAGPAGLAVAGRLRKAGLNFILLEKGSGVGQSWRNHYDRLRLHTVKQLSALPHMAFPDDYPRYVPREKLIAYFEQYAKHFDIRPEFNTNVNHVTKQTDETWHVVTDTRTIEASHVIFSTGVNRVPIRPQWDGMQAFGGTLVHSSKYKNPEPYRGKRVLVVGMGNTGAEIALDLCESDIPTWLSVRSPVNIVPRDLNGQPVQLTSRLLAKLPFGMGDWIGSKVQRLYFGNLAKYGIDQSKQYPVVQLRETGKTPVIDVGTIQAIKRGKIQVVGDISKFVEDGVILKDGTHLHVEHVILATGFRPQLDEYVNGIEKFLDKNGRPISPIGTGEFSGLYFVGFDNYKLDGVFGTIATDSQTVVDHLVTQYK